MNSVGHLLGVVAQILGAVFLLSVIAVAAFIAWLWINERVRPRMTAAWSLWRAGIIAGRWTRRADRLADWYFPPLHDTDYDTDPDNEESL